MENVRAEWDEILVSKDVDNRLEDLQLSGRLASVFPSLQALVGFGGAGTGHKCLWSHTKLVVKQTTPQPLLRWASLFHDVGKPQSFVRDDTGHISFHHHEFHSAKLFKEAARDTRLFTDSEVVEVAFVIYHLGHIEAYSGDWKDSAVRRVAKTLGQHLDSTFAVARADCTTANPKKRQKQLRRTRELWDRIETLKAQDAVVPALPKGLGQALMAQLGLPAGRELGQAMARLKARVEAGELPRSADISVYLKAL